MGGHGHSFFCAGNSFRMTFADRTRQHSIGKATFSLSCAIAPGLHGRVVRFRLRMGTWVWKLLLPNEAQRLSSPSSSFFQSFLFYMGCSSWTVFFLARCWKHGGEGRMLDSFPGWVDRTHEITYMY